MNEHEIEEKNADEKVIDKVMTLLTKNLTKDEFICLGDMLDGGYDLLDPINEHLYMIAPEIFHQEQDVKSKVLVEGTDENG